MIELEEENIGLELGLSGFFSESDAAFGHGGITDVAEMVEIRRPLPAYRPDTRRPEPIPSTSEWPGYRIT